MIFSEQFVWTALFLKKFFKEALIKSFASDIANVLFFISLIIILASAIIPAIYGEIIYSKEKKAKVNLE